MGKSKQLITIQGEPLLVRMAREALKVSNRVIVVLGARFEEHQKALAQVPVEILHHAHWDRGMGSSIKEGLMFTTKGGDQDAILVMACDQPMLTAAHLEALMDAALSSGKDIVGSAYAGTIGIPVLFRKSVFPLLLQLGDSEGARKVILQNQALVTSVNFKGGEIDLDTPDDLAAFRR